MSVTVASATEPANSPSYAASGDVMDGMAEAGIAVSAVASIAATVVPAAIAARLRRVAALFVCISTLSSPDRARNWTRA
ncbi:hypothetical protein CCO02nite_22780 [Cellulomonas composti]|uniref:Uncharacterized protein n=1 Tax=Cellulomonas composti TaxID=266130 RepID=A0A511JCA3_9CELL|nr:hypothetical protein CCO02nite_22780 [Cellulomonas composti]